MRLGVDRLFSQEEWVPEQKETWKSSYPFEKLVTFRHHIYIKNPQIIIWKDYFSVEDKRRKKVGKEY